MFWPVSLDMLAAPWPPAPITAILTLSLAAVGFFFSAAGAEPANAPAASPAAAPSAPRRVSPPGPRRRPFTSYTAIARFSLKPAVGRHWAQGWAPWQGSALGGAPAAAQRLEDGDLVLRQRRVGGGHGRLGGHQRLFGGQQLQLAERAVQ